MIIEILKGSIPFVIVFVVVVVTFTYSLMGLRGDLFVDMWSISYRLAYGDFEEIDEHTTYPERILFFIATIALPLIMLNLLIAVMGDIYDRVQENQVVADVRERLLWILELGRFACMKKQSKFMYIHVCQVLKGVNMTPTWEGKIRTIKRDQARQTDALRQEMR
jgi:hypothetical protein